MRPTDILGPVAIHDTDEFLCVFGVGSTLWTIQSHFGKPTNVVSETITGFPEPDEIERDIGIIYTHDYISKWRKEVYSMRDFVGDTINIWHGAFTSEADAQQTFCARLWFWENDPELSREYVDQIISNREMDEMFDSYYYEED